MSASTSARIIVRSSRSGRMRAPTLATKRVCTVRRIIARVCYEIMAVTNEIRRCPQICYGLTRTPCIAGLRVSAYLSDKRVCKKDERSSIVGDGGQAS
jgi:hypothetical protein